jgi:predicted acylesterase/phospholipase RssA
METRDSSPDAEALNFCDVVMKGGITSGIVFPRALVNLSRTFRFKNIGGTSAGAIAAAAAAAAELRRQKNGTSFDSLDRLPNELGQTDKSTGRSRLFGLFQPQRGTFPLFAIGTAALGDGWKGKLRLLSSALRYCWLSAFIGALPGLWLLYSFYFDDRFLQRITGLAIAFLVTAVGVALLVLYRIKKLLGQRLPENLFGLCTGMPGEKSGANPPLTVWLENYLNKTAGKQPGDPPLTFGDLWGTRDPDAERSINLEVMTTCLTHGRPYRLPFRDDGQVRENSAFFFHADEFRQLFPEHIVQWMIGHPRPLSNPQDAEAIENRKILAAKKLHPLPEPADLPVIVATRMSLSFPVLLSAVPLYAIDFTREKPDELNPVQCWFSDGGICSNFPLHFFDSALPRWPTFAINLADKHPDYPAGVYMPKKNTGGLSERWNHFAAPGGFGALFGFIWTIINTAKDWPDTLQSRLPGYRDRIATVSLEKEDGGLNLDMPEDRIKRIANFGADAGAEFVRRFGPGPRPPGVDLTWENHRRIRLRSTLACLEELILSLERSCSSPIGTPPYDVVMNATKPYPWTNAQQKAAAVKLLGDLRTLARQMTASGVSVIPGSPRPRPELRVRPRT